MAGDGIAARLLSLASVRGSCGAPHYILQRTIVLNKVEVVGGDGAKRNAKVAHDGHGFQENLWEQDCRAPILLAAVGGHLFHAGDAETKVDIGGGPPISHIVHTLP